MQRWIIIFTGGVLLAIFFSRLYCGWACPIGNLMRFQSWLYKKMGLKRFKAPELFKNKRLRWLWLILFIGAMVVAKRASLKLNMLLYITLIGIVFSFFFEEEFWHKYLCPYGTILSTIKKPYIFRMQINQDQCNGCGLCERICPNKAITVTTGNKRIIDNRECLLCFKCKDTCPSSAIYYNKNSSTT